MKGLEIGDEGQGKNKNEWNGEYGADQNGQAIVNEKRILFSIGNSLWHGLALSEMGRAAPGVHVSVFMGTT